MVFPIVLGSGFRVFPDDAEDAAPLALAETKVFDSGAVVHHYVPTQP